MADGQQVFLQARQVQQHAGYQRQSVQHRHRAHEVDAHVGKAERVMQVVDEVRQLAAGGFEGGVLGGGASGGELGVGGGAPCALLEPVRGQAGLVLGGQVHMGVGRGRRMGAHQCRDETVDSRGVDRHRCGGMAAPRVLPGVQFVVEDGDRAGEERDEQRPARHQAHPGMQRLIQT